MEEQIATLRENMVPREGTEDGEEWHREGAVRLFASGKGRLLSVRVQGVCDAGEG